MFNNKIDVAKGFQTSVNIAYDLNNTGKISGFIPTMSSLDIIEDVLLSTAPNSTERARILIGAYGRGKSHIILVLLSLLFKKDKAAFSALLKKMKNSNPKLYEYTNEFMDSGRKLLPIVVGGSSASLTQSFLFALQQALNDENLSNFMPETHFKASVNAIESWKSEYPETYNKFLDALNEPIEEFVLSLKEYNVEAYEKFVELYPSLTSGSSFNPFLGFDVVELYEKVVDKLCEVGYDGVYIVYDEFSKYLESSIGNATISDIKLLQDFAEKCVRSGKKQMHLMLICHKDIANYIDNNLPKEKVDGWRGVSGRFKHTTLHNNFAQMYEIISAVIKKDPDFWKEFVSDYKAQLEDLKERYVANGLIDGKDTEGVDSAIYGCYPLHPISTFILPRLSEKVAQNERTLFTFLSSQEKHTLSSFLESADGEFPLLTPDYLYDYFEPLFRKEVYTSEIHKNYKLTSNILQKFDLNSIHARIIKTISLIYMVEQYEKLPPVYDIIVDAFRESVADTKEISDALEDLINKDCIVYLKRSNNYLKLKESSGVDIPGEIEKKIESNKDTLRVKDILNNSSFDSYMYPTRYNDEHEITRYFDFLFIDSKEFWSTENWELKIVDTKADGVVYAVIPESKEDISKMAKKIASESYGERVVICLPKKFMPTENTIKITSEIEKTEEEKPPTDNQPTETLSAASTTTTTEKEKTAESEPTSSTESKSSTTPPKTETTVTENPKPTGNTSSAVEQTEAPPTEEIYNTQIEVNTADIEKLVVQYINEYRVAQGDTAATVLTGLTEVARIRATELVTNFAHTDGRTACGALKYGEYVDLTPYGLEESDNYYLGYNREAIGKGSWFGTAESMAHRIADGFRNSENHWRYVGDSKYCYIAVGVVHENNNWYVCVCLSHTNYGG